MFDTVAIDIGPRFVGMCRLSGGQWHAMRLGASEAKRDWQACIGRLGPPEGGAFDLILRADTESLLAESIATQLVTGARAAGARRVRMLPRDAEPLADPCVAVARQSALAHRLPRYAAAVVHDGRATIIFGDHRAGVLAFERADLQSDGDTAAVDSLALRLADARSAADRCLDSPGSFGALPLLCFGDGAPGIACALAKRSGCEQCLIPPRPALLPTFGLVSADIVLELRRDLPSPAGTLEELRQALAQAFDALCEEITREGYDLDDATCDRFAIVQMDASRRVELDCDRLLGPASLAESIRQALSEPAGAGGGKPAVAAVRVRAVIETAKPPLPTTSPAARESPAAAPRPGRLHRSMLAAGTSLAGPLYIEDELAVIAVDCGWSVDVLSTGSVLLRQGGRQEAPL